MRVTGTRSAQTAGCGHKGIQLGLLVKQDNQLQRIAFTHTSQVLIHGLPYRSGPAAISTVTSSDVQCSQQPPVTAFCQLQRIPGDRNLLIPPLLARRQLSSPVMTTGLPVTEVCRLQRICWWHRWTGIVYKKKKKKYCYNQTVTEPTDRVPATQPSLTSCFTPKFVYRQTPGYWTSRSTKGFINDTNLWLSEFIGYRETTIYQTGRGTIRGDPWSLKKIGYIEAVCWLQWLDGYRELLVKENICWIHLERKKAASYEPTPAKK